METPGEYNVNLNAPEKKNSSVWKWLGRLFRLCLAAAVIAATGAVTYYWITNPPVTQRRPKGPEAILVEVTPITVGQMQVKVKAMGTVLPNTEIQLAARVSGQLIKKDAHFSSGEFLSAGQTILQVDPQDFELAVRQQEGNLIRAQSDLQLEMGQQSVAQREYELLQDSLPEENTALLLREPQLAAKKAAVEVAKVALEKARLDLERTTIKAPFNCVVLERKVDLGSYISAGTPLATLVCTDEFYVEVSVPADELKWINFPNDTSDEKSHAKIYNPSAWGDAVFRVGEVRKFMPSLEAKGRMVRVRITVANPLGVGKAEVPPLLLDSFVRAEIEGKICGECRTDSKDSGKRRFQYMDNASGQYVGYPGY